MRAFVAIELNDGARAALADFQFRLRNELSAERGIRWTRAEQFHVTLYFLSDVDTRRFEELSAALSEATKAVPPFNLSLGAPGCFPSAKQPRVWWAGIGGSLPELELLQTEIRARVERFCDNPERRPYHPHLTIARIREPNEQVKCVWRDVVASHPPPPVSWEVDSVRLVESRLKSSGAEHEERLRIPL